MHGALVVHLSLACGVALAGGCGGTTASVGQSGGTGGDAALSGGTDGGGAEGIGGPDTSGTGGSAGGTGDSAGGTGGGDDLCSNVTPCGGDLVGTWDVTSSCLTASGDIDLSNGLLFCTAQLVAGSLQVSGVWTANGDGTFADGTRTTGSHHLELGEECKVFDATPISCEQAGFALQYMGYADTSCVDNATTDGCTCEAVIDQPGPLHPNQIGGIGFAPDNGVQQGDSYTTVDNVLRIDDATYSYCVSGTRLSLTPVSADYTGTLVGSVVLQRQ